MEFLWRYQKYAMVMIVFTVFTLYTVAVVPKEVPQKSRSSASQSADRIAWNITTENPEKTFPGVLEGRSGDWYRMSVSLMASRGARIEVVLYSLFGENAPIGSFDVTADDDFQYREIVFQIPTGGVFSDIKFILRGEDSSELWSYTGVKVLEPALSRLNVSSKSEALRLAPSLVGNIEHVTKRLALSAPFSDPASVFESRFVAEGDFIESIRLNAKEKANNKGHVLELREGVSSSALGKDVSIKKVTLSPGELELVKDEWENQSVMLPARLERGKEYLITLRGTGDASHDLVLAPLKGSNAALADGKNVAAIVFGQHTLVNGVAVLSGAKVEDFGGGARYLYSLKGGSSDFFDLFDTEGKVKFDEKKKMVAGEQKQHTSFTYRFFTVYPFEKFMLTARQAGDSENEVRLEYSFDNAFWQEVPFIQVTNEPQMFSLALSGTGNQDTVYVRVSYTGEDKKTRSFGLDQLSVRAQLIRK